jgi:hypothetical protein
MSKPLVVSIPHSLGKPEAMRRLQGGTAQLVSAFGDNKLTSIEEKWTENRLDFSVGAVGQTVKGNLEVLDDLVRLEIHLPWVLALFAERAKSYIEKQGTLMLEKK